MSSLKIDKLFVRNLDGSIKERRKGVWSSTADACLGCGTTEAKHEAHGRCRLCYLKFKRATDPAWRERQLKKSKMSSIKHAERCWMADRKRQDDPVRREQRKAISARWYEINRSKWPIGSTVWHEPAPGVWISGVIEAKTNTRATVRFRTCEDSVPFARLRKAQPFQVMEGQVA